MNRADPAKAARESEEERSMPSRRSTAAGAPSGSTAGADPDDFIVSRTTADTAASQPLRPPVQSDLHEPASFSGLMVAIANLPRLDQRGRRTGPRSPSHKCQAANGDVATTR